jgi:hypothetical protein
MKNSVKLTPLQKYEKLANKVSNKTLVNELIRRYQVDTKNAVQNILNMCKTIKEFDEKLHEGSLTETDFSYFCASVNLDKSSSTFRKFRCIGDKADLFEKYLEKVPASYTILYEIATLDPDQFDLLVKSKQLSNYISLKEVKQIAGKITSGNTASNKSSKTDITLTVKFDSLKVTKSSLRMLANFYRDIKILNGVNVTSSNDSVLLSEVLLEAA